MANPAQQSRSGATARSEEIRARIPKGFSIPSWPAWIQMIVACFAGAAIGGYVSAKIATSGHEEILQRNAANQTMERFITLGGEILKEGDRKTEEGLPVLKGLGFYAIDNSNQLRRAIFNGGLLPGIRELYFAPFNTNRIGVGVADGGIMRLAARNFPNVQTLDVSNCRLADIEALAAMPKLTSLKLVNNPLTYAEIQALGNLRSVRELWIGWPDSGLKNESLYRTPEVRRALLKSLKEMPNLKKVHLYELRLREAERKELGDLEVVNERI